MEIDDDVAALAAHLRRSVAAATGGAPCSVLFSGGVDSAALAELARSTGARLVVVGVPGSHDLEAARSGAAALALPLTVRELDAAVLATGAARWSGALTGADRTARAVTLGLALALEATPPGPVLCGQGADELFLGYAHFDGLGAAGARRRRAEDLDRLRTTDWPRIQQIAAALDRRLAAPYLDDRFCEAVLALDIGRHLLPDGPTKPLLRALAGRLGVPAEIVARPKKALQYGSGIAKALAKLEPGVRASGASPP